MRVLAFKGCVAATATMARENGKFSSSVMEEGWPEVGRNELAVVGGERAVGEEAARAVTRGESAGAWRYSLEKRRRVQACLVAVGLSFGGQASLGATNLVLVGGRKSRRKVDQRW